MNMPEISRLSLNQMTTEKYSLQETRGCLRK